MASLNYYIPRAFRKFLNPCAVKDASIDKTAKLDYGSVVVCTKMKKYSYIGEHTSVIHADIGSFTSISNYCAIGGGQHPMEWVSMSPVFNSSTGMMKHKFACNIFDPFCNTVIGNDVWIGSHCLIRSGVTVDDGAVIAMGSVLTKNVGPYEIWGGNPARLIKKRFTDEIIEMLLEIKWWDWPEDKLKKNAQYFNSPEEFINLCKRQAANREKQG